MSHAITDQSEWIRADEIDAPDYQDVAAIDTDGLPLIAYYSRFSNSWINTNTWQHVTIKYWFPLPTIPKH